MSKDDDQKWQTEYGVTYRQLQGDETLELDVSAREREYVVLHVPTGKTFVRRIGCFSVPDLLTLLDNWNRVGNGVWVHWTRSGDKRFVLVEPGAPCDPLESGGYSTSGMIGEVGVNHLKAYVTEGPHRSYFTLLPGERSAGCVARHGLQGTATVDVVRVA